MRYAFSILFLLTVAAGAKAETRSETWHDAARNRDVPIKLYLPTPVTAETRVVIFSPGLGGTRDGYSYLGQAWSAHGYAVLVLQHVGSDFAHILDPTAMQPAEYIARTKDVRFALDQLQHLRDTATDPLSGKLNLKQVAMGGHSYGAVTTEAMAGQVMPTGQKLLGLSDPRIVCAMILSPSPPRAGDAKVAFSQIKMPLLHLTGTEDDAPVGGIVAKERRVMFDVCPATPQYLVIFKDGDHMVFSGRPAKTPAKAKLYDAMHPVIVEATTHFLDAYLRDDKDAAHWLKQTLPGLVKPVGTIETK